MIMEMERHHDGTLTSSHIDRGKVDEISLRSRMWIVVEGGWSRV